MKKLLFVVIFLVIIIIIGNAATIYRQYFSPERNSTQGPAGTPDKNAPVITVDPNEPPQEITLEGEYICLPHKDTKGPQTMECALGMKLADNTYVALDMAQSNKKMNIPTGSKTVVNGLYVPVEQLNTTTWQKYPIKGILNVTDIKKK